MSKGIKEWLAGGNLIMVTSMLLAFALPFGKVYVPPFIALFVFSLIISPGFARYIAPKKTLWYLLLVILFYLMHVLGMLWTDNTSYGILDLEIKASLLVIPALMIFTPVKYFTRKLFKAVILSLFAGCIISVMISGIIAYGLYKETGDICSFYYSTSSHFMHTSYISLYIVFVLYALYSFGFKRTQKFYIIYFFALFLMFYLNLLSSKAGFITFGLAMLMVIAEIVFKRKWNSIVLYFLIPVMVFAGSLYFFPVSTSRVVAAVNAIGNSDTDLKSKGESTADRILIWSAALDLSEKNILYGTGTGDVKDELIKKYRENGLKYPAELNLNAHNQFIQSLVTLGFLPVLLLFAIFAIPLWVSIKKRQWLYFAFICFFVLNIMVESMMEVQAGIVFYVFFNVLLWVETTGSDDPVRKEIP